MANSNAAKVPPYVSFTAFSCLIEELSVTGVSGKIGEPELAGLSVHIRAQLLPALRYLGLVDEQLEATEELHSLASSWGTDKLPQCLSALLDCHYPKQSVLDLSTCTPSELTKTFGSASSPHVLRKAQRFYLQAARAAGKGIGPKLLFGRRVQSQRASKHFQNPRRSPLEAILLRREIIRKFPEFDSGWVAEVQVAWLTSFARIADTP